ncbi:tyrosine-type recombinase/integrase [Granulicella mallensis]|uniref:Site-specific recombinase XerD n=1 Tax=Granulicella mallensis TaxID=940614 RepID=A0A7W7ZVT4_9BACT|nr:tyrosine-type recombinase/integrase [Granulicella mallensis]MBB5066176.1 site-specific recombinase XerD [Granulicella mallensis]
MPRGRKPKKMPGVYERPLGSGKWCARYLNGTTATGKPNWVRKSFGTDRDAAVAYIDKARMILRTGEGVLPVTAKKPVLTFAEEDRHAAGVTVEELADDYLTHVKANPTEFKDQINPPRVIREIIAAFGSHPASTLQTAQIDDWLIDIQRKRDLAPGTVNRIKSTFSGVYRRALQRSRVKVNPVRNVPQRKMDNHVGQRLTNEQIEKLRNAIRKSGESKAHLAQYQPDVIEHRLCELDFALGTAWRKSEQYGLLWPQVDFKNKKITALNTKNGETYVCEMMGLAEQALKRIQKLKRSRLAGRKYDAPTDAVFAIGDNKKWFAQATKDAKLKIRWHDLRHTAISIVAEKAPFAVVQAFSRHKSSSMVMRYAHADSTTIRDHLAMLD